MLIAIIAVSAADVYKSRRELIESLIEKGHSLLILTPDEWDADEHFSSDCVRTRTIFLQRTGSNPFADLKTTRDCKRVFGQERPDLIYAFSGAKAVIYSLMARPKGCRAYCTINGLGSIFRSADGLKTKIIRSVMKLLYHYSLKKADGVMFQNDDDRQAFISMRLVDADKTSLVNGSGVNLITYACAALPEHVNFLFVGRLLKDKGIREFLQAARNVKREHGDVSFSVVGPLDSNPMALSKDEIDAYTEVDYYGMQQDVRPYYRECTVFVLPSYHEGTPRTTLEAMATGRPILTTDAPGCSGTVKEGYNGVKVPVGDVELLKQRMIWFIEHPDMVRMMGENSRKMAEEKYDVRKVNARMCEIMGV